MGRKNRASRLAVKGWGAAFALVAASALAGGAQAAPQDCEKLAGRDIPASAISLPTSGAKITAQWVAAAGALPAYCKVLGSVAPVDAASTPVLLQINLPENWNGKALQNGGGGLNGTLITGLDPIRDQAPTTPTPLERGYVSFGTDGGHPNAKPDVQIFALNDEALHNHAYGAYKKTYDIAMLLIRDYYGTAAKRVYFYGGSEGGREGMIAAQRYPKDYDGIVSTVPVQSWTILQLVGYEQWYAMQNGGGLNPAKAKLLQAATNAKCDALDGLKDGVISRYRGCEKLFKPAVLRCPGGADAGDQCLSDAQIAFVERLHKPYKLGFKLANGVSQYPAFGFGGEGQPFGLAPPILSIYSLGDVRYFIARDPKFSGPLDVKAHKARIQEISKLMDATDPDLSAFQARGGKIIFKENAADYVQAAESGFDYYDQVSRKMGAKRAEQFIRVYVTPGTGHGGSGVMADGSAIPDKIDLLGMLEAWVEQGQTPPDQPVQTSFTATAPFTPVATRPMCRYPLYPHYRGSGSTQTAESFECRRVGGR